MTALRHLADHGGRLVLSPAGLADALLSGTGRRIDVRANLVFLSGGDPSADLHLERFGLTSRGVVEEPGAIGSLGMESVDPGSARLRIAPDFESAEFSFSFDTDTFYDAMELTRPLIRRSVDVESVDYERFRCTGQGRILREGEALRFDGRIEWRLLQGTAGMVTRIELDAVATPVAVAPGAHDRPSVYRLNIQPIGFLASDADLHHSAQNAGRQTDNVRRIWGNCCLDLVVRPLRIFVDPTRKTTMAVSQVSHGDEFDHAIRVYFVDADLPDGGARTFAEGQPNGRVVISDRSTNFNLLAHEIGHVFKGDHPGSASMTLWAGDAGTVLRTGNPNPAVNTVHNCQRVRNGGLEWVGGACVDRPFP